MAWFEDNFHALSIQRSPFPEFDVLITGLPFLVADWITVDAIGDALFFEASDWSTTRTRGVTVPW